MKNIIISLFLLFLSYSIAFADNYPGTSYNWSTGEMSSVDVTFNGSEMEVYNYNTGNIEYHDIDSNNGGGSFETYNWETGKFNSIDLD